MKRIAIPYSPRSWNGIVADAKKQWGNDIIIQPIKLRGEEANDEELSFYPGDDCESRFERFDFFPHALKQAISAWFSKEY